MKDNKITFEDGQLVNPSYVEIDGVRHEVTEAEYSGNTPLSAHNLNLMQDNLRENIATNESNIGTDTDTYDSTKTYAVGDITIYGNQLYKCITPITTAEEFDVAKWKKTSLKEMIESQKQELENQINKTVIETGVEAGITVPASGYVTIEVTFTKTFNEAPIVVATPIGNYNIIVQLNNISKTGFVINVRSVDGTERTARKVTWIAIEN